MQTIHFSAQGSDRTYWDFFVGFGLFVSVFLLVAAFLTWQLGALSATSLDVVRRISWAPALCFVAVAILSWRYFFLVPLVFSAPIVLCLVTAARLTPKPA